MTHITLPSGEWLLVAKPPWATRFYIDEEDGEPFAISFLGEPGQYLVRELPFGNWQLHGIDPLNLTEDEAAQVVEHELKSVGRIWMDYTQPETEKRPYKFDDAIQSYASLLAANGHKVGECVTLKKVK